VTSSPQNNQELNPIGKLLSLIALLAAALYFTGWIYRWAYFGFFQVEVTTLNLPLESFYLAAFRALLGTPWKTLGAFIVTVFVILVTLQIIQSLQKLALKCLRRIPLNLSHPQLNLLQFLASLVDELVIVLSILAALFFLAQWQADADAWRDAVNETSTLPVVTAVIAEKNAALGRSLDNPLVNPSGFRIIGDRNLYDQLLGRELDDTSNPDQPLAWRLLIDQDGYFYIFPALPRKERNLSVPVLIVYESGSGDQLTILSPKASDPDSRFPTP
jgi:hypothetical protein